MQQTFEAPMARAGSFGALFTDFDRWLDSLADDPASSFCMAPSGRVPVRTPSAFASRVQRDFPALYDDQYRADSYSSDPLIITAFRRATMLREAMCYRHSPALDHRFIVSESVGYGMAMPLRYENPYVRLERREAPIVSCTLGEAPDAQGDDDGRLNILLSSVNNYGHWHAHAMSLVLALKPLLGKLMSATATSRLRMVSPIVADEPFLALKSFTGSLLRDVAEVEFMTAADLERPVVLSNVIVGSTNSLDNGPRWSQQFADLFPQARLARDLSAPRLIYCNRSHTGTRGVENEAELQSALERLGFHIASPGLLEFDRQRRLFSNAQAIIGAHGGALTNLVYAHPHPLVVELTHDRYGFVQYQWFRMLASVMGSDYAPFVSPVPPEYLASDYMATFFRVDVARFLDLLVPELHARGLLDPGI